jgi:hypothetical protein
MKKIRIYVVSFIFVVLFMTGCNENVTNPTDSKAYNLTLWTNYLNGQISISINGKYAGDITKAYSNMNDCNSDGCFSMNFNKTPKIYITATETISGHQWKDSVEIKDSCKILCLKNNKYEPPPPPKKYELTVSCSSDLYPLFVTVNADKVYLDEYDNCTLSSTNQEHTFIFSGPKTIYIELLSTGYNMKQGNMEFALKEGSNYLYIDKNSF